MEYKQLSDRQQRDMLRQRQIQFEGEHFNHAVNLQLLEATKDTGADNDREENAKAIADAKKAMRTIELAHDHITQLIADIPEDADEPPADQTGNGTGTEEVPEPDFNPIKSRAERRTAARPSQVKKATAHMTDRSSSGAE